MAWAAKALAGMQLVSDRPFLHTPAMSHFTLQRIDLAAIQMSDPE